MNNRPIKFRVWDSADECWIDPTHLHCNTDGYLYLSYGLAPQRNTKRFIVQQFTGLTDSTGKEIYEGDIVCEKMTDDIAFEGGECNLGRVFFATGTFMIDGDGTLYDHTYSLTPDRLEDYLVVGNVFETPELLA